MSGFSRRRILFVYSLSFLFLTEGRAATILIRGPRGVVLKRNVSGLPSSSRGSVLELRNGKLVSVSSSRLGGRGRNRFRVRRRPIRVQVGVRNPVALPPSPQFPLPLPVPVPVAQQAADTKHGNGPLADTTPQGRPVSDSKASSNPPGLCSDLNGAVCNDSNELNRRRQAASNAAGVAQAALADARIPQGGLAQVFRNALRAGNSQYQSYLNALVARLPGDTTSALETIRESLRTAITTLPFSEGVKVQIRNGINNVKYRVAPNLQSQRSRQAFVENCGVDGMTPGAFASPDFQEAVICPGLILRGTASALSTLVHVVAHETAHTFPINRGIYNAMGQCYLKRFPELGGERLEEVMADAWGAESLAVLSRGKSKEETFSMVKAAVAPLCGSRGSDEHPSGAFRINQILAPRLGDVLECRETTRCTFRGQEGPI